MLIWFALAAFALTFGSVLLFGAPYLPTMRRQREAALDLLDLKPGQVFYDLGCGDGRLLRAAAKCGLRAIGYELNPFLALVAWLSTRRYGSLVSVRWANFWRADISDADGVFVFLITPFMTKLDDFMRSQKFTNQVKLASYAFQIPGRKPAKKSNGVFLYNF